MNASALALITATVVILTMLIACMQGSINFSDIDEYVAMYLVGAIGLAAPKPTLGGPSE